VNFDVLLAMFTKMRTMLEGLQDFPYRSSVSCQPLKKKAPNKQIPNKQNPLEITKLNRLD